MVGYQRDCEADPDGTGENSHDVFGFIAGGGRVTGRRTELDVLLHLGFGGVGEDRGCWGEWAIHFEDGWWVDE